MSYYCLTLNQRAICNILVRVSIVKFHVISSSLDRLCGLVVRVSGYRYRGPGFDPRRYQIF